MTWSEILARGTNVKLTGEEALAFIAMKEREARPLLKGCNIRTSLFPEPTVTIEIEHWTDAEIGLMTGGAY